jgi:DNA-binding CsgD family transcriptional regulator
MLLGRDAECRTVDRLLAAARLGESQVLVVAGEPGIGKSALLAAVVESAGGMRVLQARGVASEQYVPFAGLLQLLRPLLSLVDRLPPPQAAALSGALLLGPPGDEPSRFAVGAATLSLVSRAAEDRPVALVVDDAHLLDQPSAEAVVFAARRLVSDPVAVLAGVRPEAAATTPWASLPTLALGGLSLEAAGELLAAGRERVGRDHLARLHALTGGNPLALLELAGRRDVATLPAAFPVDLPAELARAFAERADGLPAAARTTLLVAATDSASTATVYAACAALGVPDPRLTEAEDAGLVRVTGDRVEFRHPLVRSGVYGAASPSERRAAHRALAAVVPADEPDRLAWHLAEAASGRDEETAATLDSVAAQASARGAHAIAAYAFERSAALTASSGDVCRRLTAAGEAAWLAGLADRAAGLLDRALGASAEPGPRAHVAAVRAAVEARCGSLDRALALLLREAERCPDPDPTVRLLADAVHVSFYLGDAAAAAGAGDLLEQRLADVLEADTAALGALALGMARVLAGPGARGIALVRDAAYRLSLATDETRDRFRLPLRVQGALWLRGAGPSRQVLADAVARTREHASLGSLPYLLMHIARDQATTDRWADAEEAYLEGIRLAQETGHTTELAASWAGLAQVLARQGKEAACREAVAEAAILSDRHQVGLGRWWLTAAQGDLAAGLGDLDGAVRHYTQLEELLAAGSVRDPDPSCAPELVEALVRLGRLREAAELAEGYAARAADKGEPWGLARAERALALTRESAEERFRAAAALHAETPDRYEAARTALAHGSWLRRDRRRAESRALLREALATFEELGAAPWTDAAARELRATGVTVSRRHAGTSADLTPQERQIARLLCEGRTTRQAAAELFLSPKTVEYHLRHVYLKLGVSSRAELAERLGSAR